MNVWMEAVVRGITFDFKGQATLSQIVSSKDFDGLIALRARIKKEIDEAQSNEDFSFLSKQKNVNTTENEIRYAILTDVLNLEKDRREAKAHELKYREFSDLVNKLNAEDEFKKLAAMTPEQREKELEKLRK